MLGLIAGNGRFPIIVAEEAERRGLPLVVAAIREETDPGIEQIAARSKDRFIQIHWLGLGQLGKLLKLLKTHQVDQVMMCGQVRHVRIFARDGRSAGGRLSALPDWRMMRLLLSLARKNTGSLIGAVADALAEEGVELIDSTHLVEHLLAQSGTLSRRAPDADERKDIECGRSVARRIVDLDIGQTVVVRDQAVVAVEAMEGTDETIRRAARLAEGRRLTVIKASRPGSDRRFDVPVLGRRSLEVFRECRVSAIAIDAGTTLLLDREELIREADEMKLALVAD